MSVSTRIKIFIASLNQTERATSASVFGLAAEYSSCFISVLALDLYVCCFDALLSRSLLRGPNNLYVYELQQNLGRGLLERETGLNTPVIYYWPFQCGASVVVYSKCNCSSASC